MTSRAVELHPLERWGLDPQPPDHGATEFVAACPCGNPDALWRCWRRQPAGEPGADYLGAELPAYQVVCACCGPEPDAG